MTSPPHNSGRQQAGSWGELGGDGRPVSGGGVEGERWEAYMTITEHFTVFTVFSPSDWISLFHRVHFFRLVMSFPCWARLPANSRGKAGGGGFLFWEMKREGGVREPNRKQRRRGTSPVWMINSWATGSAMVSEGPAVSIMAMTHSDDVTASQLWDFGLQL